MQDRLESTRKLFPLPLTSMEQFHYHQDLPAFPNLYFARFHLLGDVNPGLLEQALVFASQLHPMVHAIVEKRGRRLRWKFVDEVRPLHDLTESNAEFRIQPFDLQVEPGYRCYLRRLKSKDGPALHELLFQGHHAAGDGAAALQFTSAAFQAYDNLVAGRKIDAHIRKPKLELLPTRGNLGLMERRYIKNIWKIPVGLFGATKFLFRKHRGLTSANPRIEWTGKPPTLMGAWMDASLVHQWRSAAQQAGVTLNSILMRELYRTLDQWNAEFQPDAGNEWIRVVLPINIRGVADRWLPGVNKSSIVQIDRKRAQMRDESAFLQLLHREVDIIRKWQLDRIFLIFIRMMSLIPGQLRASARKPVCRGAALWTNLGQPLVSLRKLKRDGTIQIGNSQLVEMDLCGPICNLTPANFSVYELDDRLRLGLRVDPRQLDLSRAERLFQIWLDNLGVAHQ